jgi:hypothetical protein
MTSTFFALAKMDGAGLGDRLLAVGPALAEDAEGLPAVLLEVAHHGLVEPGVALAAVLEGQLLEAQLEGGVAVLAVLRLDLDDLAGADLDDRHRLDVAVLVPDLRHADLAADEGALGVDRHGLRP